MHRRFCKGLRTSSKMTQNTIKTILFFTTLFSITIFFIPGASFANGGDQRVVEKKYLINLSRSPFTPKAHDNVALIASFVDIQTGKLISEDLILKVRIAKLGEGRERKFIFDKDNLIVKGGISEFQYTFNEPGLHEIFFDFAFASNPQKIYNAPDFLLDIQKASTQETPNLSFSLWLAIGAILGFVGGLFIRRASLRQ